MATMKQLITARDLYVEKKEYFVRLCHLHLPLVPVWFSMDREPVVERNGNVRSVYSHFTQKREFILLSLRRTLMLLLRSPIPR
jgi:hypothetical protein